MIKQLMNMDFEPIVTAILGLALLYNAGNGLLTGKITVITRSSKEVIAKEADPLTYKNMVVFYALGGFATLYLAYHIAKT